jgi:organic radical activating enzyme
MTCVYCCKQYSSAWSQDIFNNGTYNVVTNDDRFTINTTDKLLQQLSHNQIGESTTSKLLFQEIENISKTQNLKKIEISGGEPFLYNKLSEIINSLPDNIDIIIFSGLGVDQRRFKKELSKISSNKKITVVISAENIESMYEFVRYGNTWSRFIENIEYLESQQINYEFHATVSNLTIFGLKQFSDYFKNKKIIYQPVTDPDFLNISVMDNESKNNLRKQSIHWSVTDALDIDPTHKQCQNLKQYLMEFTKRRHLSLELFPESFVKWINHESISVKDFS